MVVQLTLDKTTLVLFSTAGSLVVLFLLAPLLLTAVTADYQLVASSVAKREVLEAFANTLVAASLSTLVLTAVGVPLAYLLARCQFKGRQLVEAIVDLPLALPHAVAGVLVLVAYGSRAPVGSLLAQAGLAIEDRLAGVVLAMAYVSAPFLVDSAKDGFKSIDPMLEHVARTLGATPLRVFTYISLPLAWRSIATGALLSWARAVSEVGALLIVAYYPKTVNILIVEWFNTYGLAYAKALTIPLLALCILVFTLIRLSER